MVFASASLAPSLSGERRLTSISFHVNVCHAGNSAEVHCASAPPRVPDAALEFEGRLLRVAHDRRSARYRDHIQCACPHPCRFPQGPPLPLLLCVPWYRAAIITVSNGPHERICAHMPPIAHRIFCPMLTGAPRGFPPELLHQRQGARFPSGGRGSLPRRQEPFPAGGTRTHRQVKLIPTRHLHLLPGVFPALIHPRGRQGTTGSRGENLQRRPCAVR